MSDRDFLDAPAARAVLAQRSEVQASEAAQAAPPSAAHADAVDRVVCRSGDSSCAAAHAAAIGPGAVSRWPARDAVMRLQRQYGNRYAGQVLHLARQAEAGSAGSMDVERSIEGARGGGQAMDSGVRSRLEPSYGADFSAVRVHTDDRADSLSRSLSARAFTTGQDIFFRQGEYNPGTSGGRELLAHELTHVVQQNGDKVQRKMTVSQPGDHHEIEADQMARTVMQQEHQPAPTQAARKEISRAEADEEKLHAKADLSAIQRQPEVPKMKEKDDEEHKKLHAKLEPGAVSRQTDEEPK